MHNSALRPSRVERTTSSCGECRRRKQKCNKGRPCSNCVRRFPQPPCEYKTPARSQTTPTNESRPGPFISSLSAPSVYPQDSTFHVPGPFSPGLPLGEPTPLQAPWSPYHGENAGEVVSWSGINAITQFPGSISPQSPWSSPWTMGSAGTGPASLPGCDNDCTLHSDAVHGAMRLLQSTQRLPPRGLGRVDWNPRRTNEIISWLIPPPEEAQEGGAWTPSPVADLANLPFAPSQQNVEMMKIFVQLLSRFRASLDGCPDSSNQYLRVYVPFVLSSPLLIQVAMYTSACFLCEVGHLDKTVAIAYKSQAIQMLNDRLLSDSAPSDETVAALVQLTLDEAYTGETRDLRAHMRGLREMIRSRGGFRALGQRGILGRLAMTSDVCIALSYEKAPLLQDGAEFELVENMQAPLKLAQNTPLAPRLPRFAECAEALGLHRAVAAILDDMRFLVTAVLALPDTPSPKELQKVQETSAWMYNRTLNLPQFSPLSRRPSPAPPEIVITDSRDFGGDILAENVEQALEEFVGSAASSRRGSYHSVGSHSSFLGLDDLGEQLPEPPQAPSQQQRLDISIPENPDFLYQAVRLAALMYCRAVMNRQPFSSAVSEAECLELWSVMWRVPLATWKGILGVFNWILLAILPTAVRHEHMRNVQSMYNISTFQLSMDNLELAKSATTTSLRLQGWLGQERSSETEALDSAVAGPSSEHGAGDSYGSDIGSMSMAF